MGNCIIPSEALGGISLALSALTGSYGFPGFHGDFFPWCYLLGSHPDIVCICERILTILTPEPQDIFFSFCGDDDGYLQLDELEVFG